MIEESQRRRTCATPAQCANLIGTRCSPGTGPRTREVRNPADTDDCLARVGVIDLITPRRRIASGNTDTRRRIL